MPEQPPSLAQDWTELAEMDPTVNMMVEHNMPMNAETYQNMYGAGAPEGSEEGLPEELPAALQGFSGVGLSELPQGPMPLPEGQMGGGPHTALGEVKLPPSNTLLSPAAQTPPVTRGEAAKLTPLEPGGPSGEGQFRQSVGFKPTQAKQEED